MYAKSVFVVLMFLGSLDFTAGAQAAPALSRSLDPDGGSLAVRLSDLNLADPTGAWIALRRIHNAADEICGFAPQVGELDRTRVYHACLRDAVDHAVASLGAPRVSALNAGEDAPGRFRTASR